MLGGGSGWFRESYRHYLASKGVSTGSKISKREIERVLRVAGYKKSGVKTQWLRDTMTGGYKKVFRTARGPKKIRHRVVQAEFGSSISSPRVSEYSSLQDELARTDNEVYLLGLRRDMARQKGDRSSRRELKADIKRLRERQGEIRKQLSDIEVATNIVAEQELPVQKEDEDIDSVVREELIARVKREKANAMQERLKMREVALATDRRIRGQRLDREALIRAGAVAQSPEIYEVWLSRQVPVASRATLRIKGDIAGTTRRVRAVISGEKGKLTKKKYGISAVSKPRSALAKVSKGEDSGVRDLGEGSVIFYETSAERKSKAAEAAVAAERAEAHRKEKEALQAEVAPLVKEGTRRAEKRREFRKSLEESGIEVVE